jgi:8-hydroxy-5-deazaflavin:NADPH oxidoreductase
MTTAITGVGHIGGTVARELASGGEPVLLSATSSDKVQKLAAEIGTPATAALDNWDAVQRADAVILALWLGPMKAVIDEVADLLPGKLVIDPSNPIAIAADGTVSRTLPDGQSAGEVVASWLPQGTGMPRRLERCLHRCFRRERLEGQGLQSSFTRPTTPGQRPRWSV